MTTLRLCLRVFKPFLSLRRVVRGVLNRQSCHFQGSLFKQSGKFIDIQAKVDEGLANFESLNPAEQRDFLTLLTGLAFDASGIPAIMTGRKGLLKLPGTYLEDNIKGVAAEILQKADDWHYRRFLEFVWEWDNSQVAKFARLGLNSSNPEIKEAAEDFLKDLHTNKEQHFL